MNLRSNFILAGFSNKGSERQRFYHSDRLEERWIRVKGAAEVDYSTLTRFPPTEYPRCSADFAHFLANPQANPGTVAVRNSHVLFLSRQRLTAPSLPHDGERAAR